MNRGTPWLPRATVVLFVAGLGCAKSGHAPAAPSPDEHESPTEPAVRCPPGARLAGHPPPTGSEVFCRDSNGDRQGPFVQWRRGVRFRVGQYVDDQLDGKLTTFHVDGTRAIVEHYRAGSPHGDFTRWHPNGRVELKGGFADGLREGLWTRYDEEGRKVVEVEARGGEVVGRQKTFNPDGTEVVPAEPGNVRSKVPLTVRLLGADECTEFYTSYKRCTVAMSPQQRRQVFNEVRPLMEAWKQKLAGGTFDKAQIAEMCTELLRDVAERTNKWGCEF